jgi:hypothetical protein
MEVFGFVTADPDRAAAGLLTTTCLTVEADTLPGVRRSGVTESRPPWNAQSANAYLDAHQFVRRLEASLRLVVTGHTGIPRGGSDQNTRAAIKAIANMATAALGIPSGVPVSRSEPDGRKISAAELAARLVEHVTIVIGQLPAVDEYPTWERIRPGPDGLPPRCPNCETFSLRFAVHSGMVCCILPGCQDLDGHSPQGRLDVSKLNGEPVLAWRDGTVQVAPPVS